MSAIQDFSSVTGKSLDEAIAQKLDGQTLDEAIAQTLDGQTLNEAIAQKMQSSESENEDIKSMIEEAFQEFNLDGNTIDRLLAPTSIDTNNKEEVERFENFTKQLPGIEFEELMKLQEETNIVLNYYVLLPAIEQQVWKEGTIVPEEDIKKLFEASKIANKAGQQNIADFLSGLADVFETNNYLVLKKKKQDKQRQLLRKILLAIVLALIVLIIACRFIKAPSKVPVIGKFLVKACKLIK